MKKLSSNIIVLAAAFASVCATACSVTAKPYVAGTPVKVGLICIHDKGSTYDENFIAAMEQAVKELGTRVDGEAIIKTDVAEDNNCYTAAKDLVKQGCNVIFADSFGHESYMLRAAKEWPEVTFCHATGTKAKVAGVSNFHNAFASIYEGRYLAGYAAGLKLADMVKNNSLKQSNFDDKGNVKLGYVGAFPYAEVVSGYTAWYLGVKAVVENVVMDVTFTNSWYNFDAEKAGAATLAERGAAMISQHADSKGAPGECESRGIPNVTYNLPLAEDCPKTYTSYSKIDWAPYYKAVINSLYDAKNGIEGEKNNNYSGTVATGSVVWDCVNAEHKKIVEGVQAEIAAKRRRVFDCATFTVKGEHLTTYKADVDDMGDWQPDTEAIKTEGGITFFDESSERSAPYFDIAIDGINKLN